MDECPLCSARAPMIRVGRWADYDLYDCPDCGAGFCDPFTNPGPEYYEHKSDLYAVSVSETTDPMSFEYDEALALLRRELGSGARLLDVGCGSGGFLHRARAAGFSVSGLDFNSARANALKSRGFEVFHGGLPEFARGAQPASFDAITIFQVVEHLDDPLAWLGSAKSLLKPGGLLVVGVPNRGRTFDPFKDPSIADVDMPPHHLTRWSAAARRPTATVAARTRVPASHFARRTSPRRTGFARICRSVPRSFSPATAPMPSSSA